jgi:predicted PurR-regulated permease PerM
MPDQSSPPLKTEITISWVTLLKLAVALLLGWLAIELSRLFELLFVALLIALTLRPILAWTERRGWPRWVGILFAALLLFGIVAGFIGVLIPTLTTQVSAIIKSLPQFKENLLGKVPASGPTREAFDQLFASPSFSNPEPLLKQFVSWGSVALTGLLEFFVVLIVAIYFLADGERVYQWLLAFLPPLHRRKLSDASPEILSVVTNYMAGQFITSGLCGIYAFTVLAVLHVPNAALLASMAALFDILPIIGFFLSVIPAILLAATVSPMTAGLVALLYTAYHLLENYFIVPKIYGDRLKLSTLTVLISCMAAGLVAGVVGAIAILPIIASYPVIERIWLRPFLERDTVATHEAIDAREHPES